MLPSPSSPTLEATQGLPRRHPRVPHQLSRSARRSSLRLPSQLLAGTNGEMTEIYHVQLFYNRYNSMQTDLSKFQIVYTLVLIYGAFKFQNKNLLRRLMALVKICFQPMTPRRENKSFDFLIKRIKMVGVVIRATIKRHGARPFVYVSYGTYQQGLNMGAAQ